MASKEATIGIIVVVIVAVAIAAVALGNSSSDDSPQVRYDYTLETADSFSNPDYPSLTHTPDDGMEYAILTVMYANDGFADGISTNPLGMAWTLTVDGQEYSTSVDMYLHHGYQLINIAEGQTGTCVYVYEIPAGTPASDVDVSLEMHWNFDPPTIGRDNSLL